MFVSCHKHSCLDMFSHHFHRDIIPHTSQRHQQVCMFDSSGCRTWQIPFGLLFRSTTHTSHLRARSHSYISCQLLPCLLDTCDRMYPFLSALSTDASHINPTLFHIPSTVLIHAKHTTPPPLYSISHLQKKHVCYSVASEIHV